MKRLQTLLFSFCFVVLVFTASVSAQSSKFGIGFNLIDLLRNSDPIDMTEHEITGTIKYPVLHMTVLSPTIRFDPEFSYWRHAKTTGLKGVRFKTILRQSVIHIAPGVARSINSSPKSQSYIGVKTGLDFITTKSEWANDKDGINRTQTKQLHLFIGPYLGTEYFLTQALSLGGEFQLLYTFVGQKNNKFNWKRPDEEMDISESILKSKALVYLRWYF